MQKLRILFYGDDRVADIPGEFSFGLTDLTSFIHQGLKKICNLEITFVHRHQPHPVTNKPVQGANKLAWEFLSNYDEIWIFGDRQENRASEDVRKEEPYNVLDDYEQRVLREWMKNNGLMLTGDHARFADLSANDVCEEDHHNFVGLGAAIGRHVPRAHQLRVWDGPPTNCPEAPNHDNQNTLDGPDLSRLDLDGATLQLDETPQRLVSPSTAHKLFSWVNPAGQVVQIEFFPDHAHEGKVRELKEADLDGDWPKKSPLPQVLARGTDKRTFAQGRSYPLVVAFDGDPVNVGRIVADSSFHHYLNINLRKINGRDSSGIPLPGTPLAQIAQYYCNLALWLAPRSVREAIKVDVLFNIAASPLMQNVRGMGRERVGHTARQVAEVEIGASNLFQILGEANPQGGMIDEVLSNTFVSAATKSLLLENAEAPRTETVLGSIVQEFHEFFSKQGIRSPQDDDAIPKEEIVRNGFARAFQL